MKIDVTVRQIVDTDSRFIAYYNSTFYEATYSVIFKDNIQGSIALSQFAEMLRKKYQYDDINFIIMGNELRFKSKYLFDLLTSSLEPA